MIENCNPTTIDHKNAANAELTYLYLKQNGNLLHVKARLRFSPGYGVAFDDEGMFEVVDADGTERRFIGKIFLDAEHTVPISVHKFTAGFEEFDLFIIGDESVPDETLSRKFSPRMNYFQLSKGLFDVVPGISDIMSAIC